MNSPGIRFAVPPLVFTLCFVTAGALQWFLFSDIKLLPFLPFMLHSAFGLMIGLAGFAFMMAAWFHFLLIGTTVTTSTPVNILVENGAFHYSRNPMYVGFVSLLVAGAVGFNSLPFLIAAAFMFVYLSQYIIPREERYMNAAFPESYPSYCRKVRRWL
ncbi:methyltransferase family protein [Cohaesibacter celericrescens]|uniref:methyltransferase family protein n=1 Tax=Cohaesibacter celericrescens TaxID=2067669 RepID=UPI0035656717